MPSFNETLQHFLARRTVVGDTLLPTDFAEFEHLDAFQIGFRTHGHTGESLVSETDGGWQPGWYVIALTGLGDPIFIDASEADSGYPVYAAAHGAGRWDAVQIAPSLESFGNLLQALAAEQDIREFKRLIMAENGAANAFWQEVIDERESAEDLEDLPTEPSQYNPSDFEEADLLITDLGPQKLSVVQLISKRRGLSLKDTLALAAALPLTADSDVRMRLRPFAEQLSALGATVEFRPQR